MSNVIKASVISVLDMFGVGSFSKLTNVGERQKSEQVRAQRIATSKQFSGSKVIARMPKVASPESMAEVMWKFLFQRRSLKPAVKLPHHQVDLERLAQRSEETRVTWLGHSSLFINIDGSRILIDPVFEYASPWIAKTLFDRNVNAPISRENLPLPDAIVISHDHYDHLEQATIRYYANKEVRFFVPLAVGRLLERWGVSPSKITELDWWESAEVNSIKLTCTPANHNSGRIGIDSNSTLWCSWAIKGRNNALFYSGDSAYDTHFKQIGDKLGPFDMAFIEVAANVKEGKGFPVENWGHMQARHTVQAFHDLKANYLFPVHWSTFELFSHKWDEPMTDLIAEATLVDAKLVTPMIGETLQLKTEMKTSFWWKKQTYNLERVKFSYQN
ncbi:beta-lactamase [Vibrio galatheae]|uniref:Beta-lactamase n=1 Tax=Vibrio galatheae TaxID=579748 RepID=A0A0F4NIR5_9VIBR|nr:beta-lactamase [Vibrio galatheae]